MCVVVFAVAVSIVVAFLSNSSYDYVSCFRMYLIATINHYCRYFIAPEYWEIETKWENTW